LALARARNGPFHENQHARMASRVLPGDAKKASTL
jgi:hypothetical protein